VKNCSGNWRDDKSGLGVPKTALPLRQSQATLAASQILSKLQIPILPSTLLLPTSRFVLIGSLTMGDTTVDEVSVHFSRQFCVWGVDCLFQVTPVMPDGAPDVESLKKAESGPAPAAAVCSNPFCLCSNVHRSKQSSKRPPNREKESNILSYISFEFLTSLIWLGTNGRPD
jgi:hypothetical protein